MKKVITYGTFDLFHKGHMSLLERAKGLGDYLIVGVTSDSFDRERGKLNVRDSLAVRIESVRATGCADEIIVEEYLGQKVSDVIRFGIDIFAIGNDWRGKFDYLSKYCEVVYLERTKGISSTDLREKSSDILQLGIISDSPDDNGICNETNFVSGLELSGVFVSAGDGGDNEFVNDAAGAREFLSRFDIAAVSNYPEQLFKKSDIIYIHTRRRYRFWFARAALKAGCHVICDFPLNKPEEADELYDLVKNSGRVFVECLPLAYLRTFQQLIWLLHGGAIGQILSIDCSMPKMGNFRDCEALAAFAITRILGVKCADIKRQSIRLRSRYDKVIFTYNDASASCSVSDSNWLEPRMTILGTDGRIDIPGAWWNMSYFRLYTGGEEGLRHYSFNIEGSGFRYLLSETTQMITDGRAESLVLSREDARDLTGFLERGDML